MAEPALDAPQAPPRMAGQLETYHNFYQRLTELTDRLDEMINRVCGDRPKAQVDRAELSQSGYTDYLAGTNEMFGSEVDRLREVITALEQSL